MFPKMRRFKQQITEEECIELLQKGRRGVLAVNGLNGYPHAFTMDYIYNEKDGKLYFHTAKSGYKIDCLKENEKACFSFRDHGYRREGEWWWCVNSVICYGRIEMPEMTDEMLEHLRELGRKYYPTKESADELAERTKNRVQMLVMTIDHMTGKFVEEE